MPKHLTKAVEAARVGVSLVASFHRADPPLVWRFDLERNHSFTLGLREDSGRWQLGLTSPDNAFTTVASFTQRKDAEEALAAVENILAKQKPGWFSRILKPLAVIALILVIAFMGVALWATHKAHQGTAQETSQQIPSFGMTAQPPAPPAMKSGVPLPADEYLTPPSP